MATRERLFFGISEVSATHFCAVNMLNLLYILRDKERLHGRAIKQLIGNLYDDIWKPSNGLLYPLLNKYEDQGLVTSKWDNSKDNPNTKYIRRYAITDKGVSHFKKELNPFLHNMESMEKLFNFALSIIWGNDARQEEYEPIENISSTTFTILNTYNFLFRKKYSLPVSTDNTAPLKKTNTINSSAWYYGYEMQGILAELYDKLWAPSDGVFYMEIPDLEQKGFLNNKWASNGETDWTKQRTVRRYSIAPLGENYLLKLTSDKGGIKNKIIDLRELSQRALTLHFSDSIKQLNIVEANLAAI